MKEMQQLKIRTADTCSWELKLEVKDFRAHLCILEVVEGETEAAQKVAELKQTINDCDNKLADFMDKFES